MKKEEKKIVENFFMHFPPSHAIPRVNEALAIRTIKLIPPILDLGCGDGKFSLFTFGKGRINVGLDKSKKEVTWAEKIGVYKKVVVADAGKMPFKDGSFGTVVANSVLEHVESLDKVLSEVARILRKDGILVLTVPTPLVSEYQFWKFIPGYAEFKRRLWRHINYFGERQWQKQLERIGLKIVLMRRTNSKSAIMWADIFFPLVPIGPLSRLIPFLEKRNVFGFDKNGATLLIVAKKK